MTSTTTTLVTNTITTTAVPITTLTTVTDRYTLTYAATAGDTIYFSHPNPVTTVPTTKFDPTVPFADTITKTITETQLVVVLNQPTTPYRLNEGPWSTVTLNLDPSPASDSSDQTLLSPESDRYAYVVDKPCNPHVWHCWSPGAKAGLVIGVVFAALLLGYLLLAFCRRKEWIAHDWRFARGVEQGGAGQGVGMAPVVGVNGPLDASLASPYGYGVGAGGNGGWWGQGQHPGWGYVR
jgi:hypothetical protein